MPKLIETVYCKKHVSIATNYIMDDASVREVPCPMCEELLKPSRQITHRKLKTADFTFPVMTDDYVNLLLQILDHGFIRVGVPNERAVSLFSHRHNELKGCCPDTENPGYSELTRHNDEVYTYTMSLFISLDHGVKMSDFDFSYSKDFQVSDNRVQIRDNKWCHALLEMGFGLGTDHDEEAVLEWIATHRQMKFYIK